MIKKSLSNAAIQKMGLHESFLTMIAASIRWGEKWNFSDILTYWWGIAFPLRQMIEEDLSENTIDNMRIALLEIGGVKSPILKETKRIQLIKQSINFTTEE